MSAPTHVYIVAFSDRVVKIGMTGSPERRMRALAGQARNRGAEMTESLIVEHPDAPHMEQVMRWIGKYQSIPAWGNEYFFADFEPFVQLVRDRGAQFGASLDGTPQPDYSTGAHY